MRASCVAASASGGTTQSVYGRRVRPRCPLLDTADRVAAVILVPSRYRWSRTNLLPSFRTLRHSMVAPLVAVDEDFDTRWDAWVARGRVHERRVRRRIVLSAAVIAIGGADRVCVFRMTTHTPALSTSRLQPRCARQVTLTCTRAPSRTITRGPGRMHPG